MGNLIKTRPLRRTDWPLIEELFGPYGACGGCWCMYWRVPSTGEYWNEHKGAANRNDFRTLVEAGKAKGVLAFDNKKPVGWCSVGLRNEFSYFDRARKIPPAIGDRTWSITCFFVSRTSRNRGVAGTLLEAAVHYARQRKGLCIEGYPSKPKSSRAKIPDAFAHTGVPSLFKAAGFDKIETLGARVLYRKLL